MAEKRVYRVTEAGFILGLWRKVGAELKMSERQAEEYPGAVERA